MSRLRFSTCAVGLVLLSVTVAHAQAIFRTRHAVPGGATLRGFAASASTLVAVGDTGRILASTDGTTWSGVASPVSSNLRAVAYGSGVFVAVGDSGRILVSADASSWTIAATPRSTQLNGVAVAAGRFVAVGEAGTILTSLDAQTWAAVNSGTSRSLRAVSAYVAGGSATYLIGGEQGTILSSQDAITWTPESSPNANNINAVSGGFFSGDSSTVFWGGFTSTATTRTWQLTDRTGLATGDWKGAVDPGNDAGGLRLVVGDHGQIALGAGPFENSDSGTAVDLKAAAYARDRFYAVGADETILEGIARNQSVGHINNLSARASVSTDKGPLIGGFVVNGNGTLGLLIRAAGPALAQYNIAQPLAQPVLTVFDANGRPIARNQGWWTSPDRERIAQQAAMGVSAFPFADGSGDSALVVRLPPGVYSAIVTSADGSSGISLLELYDLDHWPIIGTARLINLSARCYVGTGEATPIVGMSLPSGRRMVFRGVGPTLSTFDVPDPLANPKLEIVKPAMHWVDPHGVVYDYPAITGASNDNWESATSFDPNGGVLTVGSIMDFRNAAAAVGAFPLPSGSKDAGFLATVSGTTTFQVSPAIAPTSGTALLEAYDVDIPDPQ